MIRSKLVIISNTPPVIAPTVGKIFPAIGSWGGVAVATPACPQSQSLSLSHAELTHLFVLSIDRQTKLPGHSF